MANLLIQEVPEDFQAEDQVVFLEDRVVSLRMQEDLEHLVDQEDFLEDQTASLLIQVDLSAMEADDQASLDLDPAATLVDRFLRQVPEFLHL